MKANFTLRTQVKMNEAKRNKAAVALGSIKSDKKAKGGGHPKIHTLNVPCSKPGYKATDRRDHINNF
jgi:hypothetical protein